MEDFIIEELNKKVPSQDTQELFTKCKNLIEMSRGQMQACYADWDKADDLCKNRMRPDTADKRAKERKEPTKMVVPLTSSQVDTFVSFLYMLYTQKPNFYELCGEGIEDMAAAKVGEALLERDLKKSNFRGSVLLNFLTNTAKYNLGVIKHGWYEDVIVEEVEQVTPSMVDPMLGMEDLGSQTVETVKQEKVVFAGNKLMSVSPYRFFPDIRFPLSRFKEGEFCGSEDDYSKSRLDLLQRNGVVAGMEHVPETTSVMTKDRRVSFRDKFGGGAAHADIKNSYIVTEIELELIPSEVKVGGTPLGWEEFPVKYLIWYANDDRIIRIERQGYTHDSFLYEVGQYAQDDIEFIGPSLPNLLEKLQESVSWFINSRITSIRKVIDNRLIVDPRGIDVKQLASRNPILLVKPAAAGGDVRRWVQQLNVQDVTGSNLTDVQALDTLAKEASGLNDNLLGQFSSGRRSASEANMVNSNAVGRVKKIGDSIWHSALLPLGENMLANHRAFLDVEQMVKVIGTQNAMTPAMQEGMMSFKQVTMADLQGNYDFMIYDGTLPSQKDRNAAGLQELFGMMMGNPQMAQAFGVTPEIVKKILTEILTSRGVKNVEYYLQSGPMGVGQSGPAAPMAPPTAPTQGEPDGGSPFGGLIG